MSLAVRASDRALAFSIVAIGIARSGPAGTVALEKCDHRAGARFRRAAPLIWTNPTSEAAPIGSISTSVSSPQGSCAIPSDPLIAIVNGPPRRRAEA
jgi:hypothetical protein